MTKRNARLVARWLGVCVLLLGTAPALAQGTVAPTPAKPAKSDWQFTLCGAISVATKYKGTEGACLPE